ncbi:hypothetical protein WA158_003594 [Blastocystis sp. Blastoise]
MSITLEISVIKARSLPIMDRNRKTTDAYVEIIGPGFKKITESIYSNLDPVWNWHSDIIDIGDEKELQETPLVFRVLDRDLYTSDNVIGCVTIDMNPILMREDIKDLKPKKVSGWFPIYDTIYGLRGEIELEVIVHAIENLNPYKDGCLGVMFFSSPSLLPSTYQLISVEGLVDGLVVDTDPEFEFFEKLRTARKTNEKRQLWLYKLSMQLRRKVGFEAQKINCNCVLGYQQYFDVEGDSGIVGRGVGTACRIALITEECGDINRKGSFEKMKSSHVDKIPYFPPHFFNTIANTMPILTLSTLPPDLNYTYITTVAVRTVKYIGRLHSSLTDLDTRDEWWQSCRDQIISDGARVGGNCIYGYRETCSIDKDICVLSCQGTAIYIGDSSYNKHPKCPYFQTHIFPSTPLPSSLAICSVCKQAFVPNVLLCTSDLPGTLPAIAPPRLVYSANHITLSHLDSREDMGKHISGCLARLEEVLIKGLLRKTANMNRNAVFGLHAEIELGGNLLTGILTGTCVYLPNMPQIPVTIYEDKGKGANSILQKGLQLEFNRIHQKLVTELYFYRDIYRQIFPERDIYIDAECASSIDHGKDILYKEYIEEKKNLPLQLTVIDVNTAIPSLYTSISKPNIQYLYSLNNSSETIYQRKDLLEYIYYSIQWKPKNILLYNITCDLKNIYTYLFDKDRPEYNDATSVINTLSNQNYSNSNDNNDPQPVSNHIYIKDIRPITLLKRVKLANQTYALNTLVTYVYERLIYKIHKIPHCIMIGIDAQLRLPGENVVELSMIAQILPDSAAASSINSLLSVTSPSTSIPIPSAAPSFSMVANPSSLLSDVNSEVFVENSTEETQTNSIPKNYIPMNINNTNFHGYSRVILTPLCSPSSYVIYKYLGNISLHFIRESWNLDQNYQIDEYFHKFLLEVFTMTKAQVRNFGGNCLINMHILPQETAEEDVDQTYNMITISGDVVLVRHS